MPSRSKKTPPPSNPAKKPNRDCVARPSSAVQLLLVWHSRPRLCSFCLCRHGRQARALPRGSFRIHTTVILSERSESKNPFIGKEPRVEESWTRSGSQSRRIQYLVC